MKQLFAFYLLVSLVMADKHDRPPEEDALDAVADEHVAKENDDIFWFAFLIGGIGTVVLVVSVFLCLACVCGVDVCLFCRKCCKSCSSTAEDEEALGDDLAGGSDSYGSVSQGQPSELPFQSDFDTNYNANSTNTSNNNCISSQPCCHQTSHHCCRQLSHNYQLSSSCCSCQHRHAKRKYKLRHHRARRHYCGDCYQQNLNTSCCHANQATVDRCPRYPPDHRHASSSHRCQVNTNNSAKATRNSADPSICCSCPCCKRLHSRGTCHHKCDQNNPLNVHSNNNANRRPMEYSGGAHRKEYDEEDEGKCCISSLCCFPFCLPCCCPCAW